MTKRPDFRRHVRERMAKTGESYTTARARVLAGGPALHVTNGDSTAGTLRETGLVERVVVWRDVLHEGPVPDVDDAQLRALRARFLAGEDEAAVAQARRSLEERDRTPAAAREGDYVLWFEADLYDQLQLAQILARLAELGVAAQRITLICIGEHVGIAHFGGLVELGGAVARDTPVRLTDLGARILRGGEHDHVELNGIDRWIGGVHLVGRAVPWRWDEGVEAIVGV